MSHSVVLRCFLIRLAGAFSAVLLGFLLHTQALALPPDSSMTADVQARLRSLTPMQMDEVLWLARCVFSEADRADEQRLVAWVVRNRVETGYRGTDYRNVVLDPYQFSAFNEPSSRRDQILAFNQNSQNPLWKQALEIALDVYEANPLDRPFPVTTRHFYSPVSMKNGATPDWAAGADPVDVAAFGIDPYRFKFYDAIDEAGASLAAQPATPRLTSESIIKKRERVRSTMPRMRSVRQIGKVKRPTRPKRGMRNE